MEKEGNQISPYLNIATILSIGGICMYILGWIYWKFYFQAFGIPFSLIDLSFDKIIVTTWSILFIVILGLCSITLQTFDSADKEWDIITVVYLLGTGLCLSIISLLKTDFPFYIIAIVCVVYVATRITIEKKNISVPFVKVWTIRYATVVLIYLFSLFYYGQKGYDDAKSILNSYEENCEFTSESGEIFKGKYITKTDSRFYLIVEDNDCTKHILTISESKVQKLKLPLK